MDYHQSVMISSKNFWKRTGCYTRLSFNMLLGTPNSWWYASRPGCPDLSVIHHADHEAYKFTLFCPCLYFQGTYRTWSDKDLFEPFSGTAQDAMSEVSSALSSRLQSKYRWGIRKDAKLPTGFVFLKRKKQFLKGRTLISYFRSYYAVLMQVTARTIDSMCVQLWPQTFGQLSVRKICGPYMNISQLPQKKSLLMLLMTT